MRRLWEWRKHRRLERLIHFIHLIEFEQLDKLVHLIEFEQLNKLVRLIKFEQPIIWSAGDYCGSNRVPCARDSSRVDP